MILLDETIIGLHMEAGLKVWKIVKEYMDIITAIELKPLLQFFYKSKF